MKTIMIRTLGGKGIGYGHFYRCLSFAKAIKLADEYISVTFLINQGLASLLENMKFEFIISDGLDRDFEIINKFNIDLFMFDSYLGNDNYLRKIKQQTKIMLIDDNNDIYDSSIPDIIYNGNIHAESLGYSDTKDQLRLLGSKYLIMKEEYWNGKQNIDIDKEGILITTGGTDEYGIAVEIINVIKDLDIKTTIIIGPGYTDGYIRKIEELKSKNIKLIYKPDSLKRYINSSKIVITAGGSTVYEVLSQKSVPIIFSIADNQDLICRKLSDIGIVYLGKFPHINYGEIIENIEKSINEEVHELDYIKDLLDGNGASRTAKEIVSNISDN